MAYILGGIIILIAAFVQGATSFGFSLIALPLLGLIFELKVIVPALVAYSILLNLIILIRLKVQPNLKELAILGIFAVLFIPLGVNLLIFVDEQILKLSVSVLMILIALLMLSGKTFNIKNRTFAYAVAGILSGLLNGAVSLSGPPVVVLLANENRNKNDFRASLTLLFFLLNIVTIFLYVKKGLFLEPDLINMMFLTPLMIIGTFLGIHFGNRIDEVKFKRLVLILLIVMGIANLI